MGKNIWSCQDIKFLKEFYPNTNTSELCVFLNRSVNSIYNKANILELKKTDEHIIKIHKLTNENLILCGRSTAFIKGQLAWNKGLKGYMSANVTSYKKGNIPTNTKIVGSKRKNKDGYTIIKQESGKWVREQVIEWEKVNGKLPKGSIIRLKVSDKSCIDVNEMQVVTRAENALLNTIHRYPLELKQLLKTICKLKKRIYEKQN